jgi:DNA-binding transcriptional ArsR family regulator
MYINAMEMVRMDQRCCPELDKLLSPLFFKALCEPNRLKIVSLLSDSKTPLTVGQIAENLPVDSSVVSRHLAILRDAGILLARKRGKEVYYFLDTGKLIGSLRAIADAFEACCPEVCPVSGDKHWQSQEQ